jgi:maltose O-acetyltransferase
MSVPMSLLAALQARIALWPLREVGPGARVQGQIWAPFWRGTIRAGRNLHIAASEEPVELHALWGGEICMGDDVTIEGGTSIEAQARVSIGNGVHIGPLCKIMDNHFHFNARDPWRRPDSQPVVIEDGANIGAGAIILPGAHVPRGASVPAGAVFWTSRCQAKGCPIPVPPPPAGLRGALYRTEERALDLLAAARALLALRGSDSEPRIRVGNLAVEGRERVRVGHHTKFQPGMTPTRLIAHEGGRIAMGCRNLINYGNRIEAWRSITIGDRCLMGSRVSICDRGPAGDAPIVIGDEVWIAHGASIDPGVTIESGSVIAAGAVVRGNVPADSVAIGNPARCMSLRMLRSPRTVSAGH